MNSGTAVADPPVPSTFASTDPVVKPNTHLPTEMESGLSSTLTLGVKLEGPEDMADVYTSAAPIPTPMTGPAYFTGEIAPTTGATSDTTQEPELVRPGYLRVPQQRLTQEVRQWMTGEFVVIHQRVRQICVQEARRMHLAIYELNLSVKRSWEEDANELVVEVVVNGNLPQSLALWDAIGDEIQSWGRKQPPRRRRILEEQYVIFVEAKNQP